MVSGGVSVFYLIDLYIITMLYIPVVTAYNVSKYSP